MTTPSSTARRALALALLAAATVLDAGAEPPPPTDVAWQAVAPGIDAASLELLAPRAGRSVAARAVRVDLSRAALRVLDSRTYGQRGRPVGELAREAGAAAAINASFFLDDLTPLGLLVSEGREINPLRRADWGVLWVSTSGEAHLQHTRSWASPPDVDFAVQSGPRLVVDGEPVPVRPNVARRSAICIDAAGAVLLVATRDPIQLADLADALRAPPTSGGLGCRQALNLDGGSSTQLAVAAAGARFDVPGIARVPIAIGAFPFLGPFGPSPR